MNRNPYLDRVSIRDVSRFYGRNREVTRIFSRIGAARPQSISIVGERRIGKSSLMNYISFPEIRKKYLPDPDRRAAVAAVFGMVAFVDAPIVWFSIRWWRDIHPSPMLETGGLSPSMRPTFWICLAAFHLLFIYLVRRRFFLEEARLKVEELARHPKLVG